MVLQSDRRPDPDLLLERVLGEERRKKRGKLKIFLGYIAGVGKTFEMLSDAHHRKNEGIDVRIGYVETHGRKETDELIEGLPVIPRKVIEYHGITLEDMDLDAIIAAHPALVLIDELAHTNAPGARHLKRYQDVEEILDAGIDVYTTLNIQHLESLNDVIAQITGVIVRETIPDGVIDEADEIELVDLPPPELIQRLKEGKIYVPDMAARAIEEFFNEGNLYALREISLRRAAERVDDQMLSYMQIRSIPGPWAAGDRLLVCIGPSPISERLVRTARRQADRMNARWDAVYVETPSHRRLSKSSKEQIYRTLGLAKKMGAETATIFGINVADTLINYAKKHNITRIVIGKTLRPWWIEVLFGSVVDQLIDRSGPIDIYVISSEEGKSVKHTEMQPLLPVAPPKGYLNSVLLLIGVTLLGWLIRPYISPTNLIMFYLLAVVISAFLWGLRPAIMTAVVGVLVFDFFFVSPQYSFRVTDTEYVITFLGLILVGSVISILVARARETAEAAQIREKETATLYDLSQDLATAVDIDSIVQAVTRNIREIFSWDSAFMLPEGEKLVVNKGSSDLQLDENDLAVATWSYNHGTEAGYDTDTLHASRLRYIPLRTTQGVLGVIGVKPEELEGTMAPDQTRILTAFAYQAALAIERVNLTKAAQIEAENKIRATGTGPGTGT
ncbi:MAG TPA: sensor histidine kinase KdpD [Methanoregulaceae archaeon]|nr:sensor histidine kinase KdpD [Methanoregulaceae archaeon]